MKNTASYFKSKFSSLGEITLRTVPQEGMALVISEMKQGAERIYQERVSDSKGMIDLALILGGGILPNRREPLDG